MIDDEPMTAAEAFAIARVQAHFGRFWPAWFTRYLAGTACQN